MPVVARGKATWGNYVTAYCPDLQERLPGHIRLRGVRADSGFCLPGLLPLWEQLRLTHVAVVQLSQCR